MKLSIVSPAYNAENHIGRCLDSILPQINDRNIEVIIVNDCATDHTQIAKPILCYAYYMLYMACKHAGRANKNELRALIKQRYLEVKDDFALCNFPYPPTTSIEYLAKSLAVKKISALTISGIRSYFERSHQIPKSVSNAISQTDDESLIYWIKNNVLTELKTLLKS